MNFTNPFDHQQRPVVSRQRLRSMMKHLAKKRRVAITFDIETSIPENSWKRTYKGKIAQWDVQTICADNGTPWEYHISATFKDGSEMNESVPTDAWFHGLCKVAWLNSGPYCYFYGEW